MCGVGKTIALPLCTKVGGPTSAPLTTSKPCVDKYSNCADLAKTNCKTYGESCAKVSYSYLLNISILNININILRAAVSVTASLPTRATLVPTDSTTAPAWLRNTATKPP